MAAPLSPPRDLTIPEPGSRTARDVLSRSLGRLLPDLAAIPRELPTSAEGRADLDRVQAAARAAAADREGAAALLYALRSPTVGALLRSLRNQLALGAAGQPFDRASADAILVEFLATLAFELDRRGALEGGLRLARQPARILSLAARAELAPPDLAIVGRPYHVVDGEILLATADNNPRATFGAEPGEPGNPVDLGGLPVEAWTATLKEALALIEEVWPELRAEIDLTIRVLVPVGYHPETHRSASYRESVGAIYLTLHPGLMTLVEALIHEFSHNKLHALFEIDPVIENPSGARYRSPVRPDLRPLRGVLLAVHAFLPVAHLYERMQAARHPLSLGHYFPERFARIRAMNREGAAVVLAHAQPTAIGQGLLAEIRRWISHFAD